MDYWGGGGGGGGQRVCWPPSQIGLNFISFVYQHMSNYIYKQAYMIYKTGFRRKLVDLFESVSHFAIAK